MFRKYKRKKKPTKLYYYYWEVNVLLFQRMPFQSFFSMYIKFDFRLIFIKMGS